ncbi:polygalacturonase 1 beta-like protein 2 [Apium graveolens]|uniref:polygalacturonase 1 beta-like protein 2 n=1 Tax=Apium graveolens TaxID=4045 RepID=UPI003D7C0800
MQLLKPASLLLFWFPFILVSYFSTVSLGATTSTSTTLKTKENPFTAKASLIRYWNKHIYNNIPQPPFLLSKASPLSAVDTAFFTKLAAQKSLPAHISAFCSSANLFCITSYDHPNPKDSNFAIYNNKNFSNYGTGKFSGADTFKNYSDSGENTADSSFTRYSRSSIKHSESFTTYGTDSNVGSANFTSYAGGAKGGSGDFKQYYPKANVPDLRFTTYASEASQHNLSFKSYTDDTNSGSESFVNYAKKGNANPVEFANYGNNSNVVGSSFNSYSELSNAANDSFSSYANNGNNNKNNFKNYGTSIHNGTDSFTNYRDQANIGDDTFQSYGKNSSYEKANFVNYGQTFNEGTDRFKEYGRGTTNQISEFKIYGVNTTFKDYAHTGVTFKQYAKRHSNVSRGSVKFGGKFFRESMLKEGVVMKMPDIIDRMPKRSFLPQAIASKLPFSTSELNELKQVFGAADNSSMEHVLSNALVECERAPSPGESKRCVGSVEDMIDFAVSVLGHNVVARTTENVNGARKNIMVGEVRGINGGRITKSVSCHQTLYPSLLYYCHSVPKVRVYTADILDVNSKAKINHGVAICHEDTSSWSPGHGAFVALGSSPGKIEVCHWIFENDLTWTTAD